MNRNALHCWEKILENDSRDQTTKAVPLGLDINQQRAEFAISCNFSVWLGLDAYILGIITHMLICVTKFCFLHWLDYSMVFGSQEYRLSPRRPLGKLTTQPFPINGLGESSGASSHESLAKNCLPPPRKDSFLKEGYSEGSDGGRDTTWSGSNIRKSQTDGCGRYVTFTTSWTSQLYIEKIFFSRAKCWPSSPGEPGYHWSQKVGNEECVQESMKTFLHLPSLENLLSLPPSYRALAQLLCRRKNPLLIQMSQGQNPSHLASYFIWNWIN